MLKTSPTLWVGDVFWLSICLALVQDGAGDCDFANVEKEKGGPLAAPFF
jgi:hypothetical protein